MKKLNELSGVLAVVAVVIAIVVPLYMGGGLSFGYTTVATNALRYPNSYIDTAHGYYIDSVEVFDGTGNLKLGTNGTSLTAIKTGSCTIWAPANTIDATSTQQAECQSATNGTLASGLTGITSDSICYVTNASSTNTTIGGIVVGGASASTTAGSIVARIANFTGTTFTWSAVASSTLKWQYTCFDPE